MALKLVTTKEHECALHSHESTQSQFTCCDSLRLITPEVSDVASSMRRQKSRVTEPTCTKKVRYRDKKEALNALHKIQTKIRRPLSEGDGWTQRRECRAYACEECKGWHLTSQKHSVLLNRRFSEDQKGNFSNFGEYADVA